MVGPESVEGQFKRFNYPDEIPIAEVPELKIAEKFGGCKINGKLYLYDPTKESLVRSDVARYRARKSGQSGQMKKHIGKMKQADLPLLGEKHA